MERNFTQHPNNKKIKLLSKQKKKQNTLYNTILKQRIDTSLHRKQSKIDLLKQKRLLKNQINTLRGCNNPLSRHKSYSLSHKYRSVLNQSSETERQRLIKLTGRKLASGRNNYPQSIQKGNIGKYEFNKTKIQKIVNQSQNNSHMIKHLQFSTRASNSSLEQANIADERKANRQSKISRIQSLNFRQKSVFGPKKCIPSIV